MNNYSFEFFILSDKNLKELEEREPAISALQSFETFILLSAYDRHPQALTVLTTALESAEKSLNRLPQGTTTPLAEVLPILDKCITSKSVLRGQEFAAYGKFRRDRNRIAHRGHSPEDDETSINHALRVGIPLFAGWLESTHSIDLFVALGTDLGKILKTACLILQNNINESISGKNITSGFRHFVKHHTRHRFLTDWEAKVLYEDIVNFGSKSVSGYDLKTRRLEDIKTKSDPYVAVDCPICLEHECLVVKLDDSALEQNSGNLVPAGAVCASCNFYADTQSLHLLSTLCEQLSSGELLEETRRAYGIK